jgi:hypothetical protein
MAAADCKPTSESCRSRPLGTTPRRPQLAPELGPFLLGQRKTRRLGRVLQSRIGGAPLVFLGGLFDWRGLLRTELQTSARFGFQLRGLRALKHPPDTPVWKLETALYCEPCSEGRHHSRRQRAHILGLTYARPEWRILSTAPGGERGTAAWRGRGEAGWPMFTTLNFGHPQVLAGAVPISRVAEGVSSSLHRCTSSCGDQLPTTIHRP